LRNEFSENLTGEDRERKKIRNIGGNRGQKETLTFRDAQREPDGPERSGRNAWRSGDEKQQKKSKGWPLGNGYTGEGDIK